MMKRDGDLDIGHWRSQLACDSKPLIQEQVELTGILLCQLGISAGLYFQFGILPYGELAGPCWGIVAATALPPYLTLQQLG
jgi:hypothetical protein